MPNNKPTTEDLELTAKLAEAILDYFHFKITILPEPIKTREWAEAQGERHDFESNKWRFEINSDLGKTEVQQADRFGWDILKISRNLVDRAYRNLVGKEATQDVIDHIWGNEKLWTIKLEELRNKNNIISEE